MMSNEFLFDPFKATNTNRSQEEMELFSIFCICVAGKTASIMAKMVNDFLSNCGKEGTPFQRIISMHNDGTLLENLKRAKTGKYNVLERGLYELATSNLDLYSCTPDDLEKITGVGMKTSRFIILHSRKNARVAIIDTHILKYLRDIGVNNVPDKIPPRRKYLELEQIILSEADRLNMTVADFDLNTWTWYANKNRGRPVWSF